MEDVRFRGQATDAEEKVNPGFGFHTMFSVCQCAEYGVKEAKKKRFKSAGFGR